MKNNFVTSNANPCLLVRQSDISKLIVAIYVDDGLIAGNDHVEIQHFLKLLMEEFKITIGSAECFLGMQIMKTSEGSIVVHQESYTLRMLSKFGMADAKHVQSPLERENSDMNESCVMSVSVSDKVHYREAVGSLMFLASATRPNLSFPVSVIARNMEKPTDAD